LQHSNCRVINVSKINNVFVAAQFLFEYLYNTLHTTHYIANAILLLNAESLLSNS
jgi:hypothetical protein